MKQTKNRFWVGVIIMVLAAITRLGGPKLSPGNDDIFTIISIVVFLTGLYYVIKNR